MSSTSRSPDGKPDLPEEPEKKKGSPGRYSMADEEEVPPTRIDSTTRMPAIKPDMIAPRSRNEIPAPPKSAPSSLSEPRSIPKVPPPSKDKKRPPIGLPTRPLPPTAPKAPPLPAKKLDRPPSALEALENLEAKPSSASNHGPTSDGVPSSRSQKPRVASSRPPHRASSAPPAIARKVSSLRPPPPVATESRTDSKLPKLEEELIDLDVLDEGSIAFAFDALLSEGPSGAPGTHSFDLTPVRELFSELAANHMRHVRDFMIDVKWGEVTRDWIHICVPPVRTLRKAATHLELTELGDALERLGSELDAANATGGQMLDANEKQRLLDAYGALVDILPQAFALDRDKTQREAVIVQALLLQVPDVRKVTIDKLHAAGLTSLTVLFEANANDIAHVAGIPHSLATRIVERVQQYRDELKSASPQDARAAEREKLATLNSTLKQHHAAYEEAQNGWGPDAKARKRDHFRAREETWLEISVLLARFGEVDRLAGIEKVPFAQRIAQLTDYLEEARDKYRSAEA